MVSLLLDGLIILLLIATIVYCAVLSRRLSALRKNEAEFQRMISSFNMATARAESSIDSLKSAAEGLREGLGARITDGKSLYDELSFIIDRGDKLADHLGGSIATARPQSASPRGEGKDSVKDSARDNAKSRPARSRASGSAPAEGAGEDDMTGYSKAERDLLKILRANASS